MAETVVVTGGAGFIGSHLVDALLADGRKVIVVDDLSTGRPERVADEAALETLDITDAPAFAAVIDAARPAAIFHLAAQSSVTVSVTDPGRDCSVNVHGTLNVVEAAKRNGAVVVFASTGGGIYGDEAPIPTPETRIPAPLAPYGASKWAGEAYVLTWALQSGQPYAVCRLANIYGPRQSPHGEAGVVAIFSHRLWSGEAPTIYGYGKPTRDYLHVRDVVDGFLRARGHGGVYNLGTGRETPSIEVFDGLKAVAGGDLEPQMAPLREGELERSCLDSSKAQQELGWEPTLSISEGLAETYRALVAEFESRAPAA